MNVAWPRKVSWLLFGVAGIALVVGLAPTFFCVGERLALCEDGSWVGDLVQGGARVAWLVLSVSLVGGALLRVFGGNAQVSGALGAGDDVQEQAWQGVPAVVKVSASEVEPISLDASLEFGAVSAVVEEDPDSLMAFVQENVERVQTARLEAIEQVEKTVDGFYCPPGMENSHVLYVDGGKVGVGEVFEDVERLGRLERAFGSVEEAVVFARTLVLGTEDQVQVRILPGMYSCAVQIPDRVVLINHRMPADRTGEEYGGWLASQQEVGHEERVTLCAGEGDEQAIVFLPGRMQGLFGCFVVGRGGVSQSGIRAVGCQLLRVFYCVIEGFSRRGMEIGACGSELPGAPVEVIGSVFRGNSCTDFGGALFVHGSVLRLEGCVFESNSAALGGAICARDLKGPLLLRDCRLQRNRALSRGVVSESISEIGLVDWQGLSGLGGAIAVQNSRMKVVDSCFSVNDAVLGGGAVAVLGSQMAIECGLGQTFVQNRAKIGGGVLAVGWKGAKSTVKARGVVFQSCKAQQFGGALALVGLSSARFDGGHFYANHCADGQGAGGAAVVLKGAMLSAVEVRFSNNLSEGNGGALAVINASLRMSGQCTVKENEAGGAGGGVYCVTAADAEMERFAQDALFAGPFALQLKELRVCGNQSAGAGGGLLAGNVDAYATFPLKVEILETVLVYENRGEDGAWEVSVRWAGEERFGVGRELPLREFLG